MVESRVSNVPATGVAPRPQVLASLTDQHVLAAISEAPEAVSRAEIAHLTGLSKPAVSSAAARLSDRGVIHSVGIRSGRRGGVATLYELNPHHGRSLAVVLHNDTIAVRARDLGGAVQAHRQAEVAPESRSAQIIATTNRLIEEVSAAYAAPLLAAAVSIADPVDAPTGAPVVLERSVFPQAALQPRTELALAEAARIVVDNDVNWATLGEFGQGELAGCDTFVYVYAGQGLGAGLFLGGRLFRGHRGLSGEIGYLRHQADPALDLTQKLASLGLGSADRYGIDLDRAALVLGGDPLGADALACADVLAGAIANLGIVVNPSAIAFGGPLSAHARFTAAVRERVEALSIDPPDFVVSRTTPLLGASAEAHRMALAEVGITTTRTDP
ncbi:MAG: ROK family protein [Propioniciclava sp.]